MYDWNDLRFFLELSRQGKLVLAAKRLQVDHTTVSRKITQLEAELNVRLFDRSPRGYQLTDAGLRLLPHAENIETQSHQLYQDIAGKDARLSGTVRVSATEGLGAEIIAVNIPRFRQSHPDIEIELVAATRRTSLSKREADIAISLSRPESGRLIAWKLCDYRLKLYGSKQYIESHDPITSIDSLQNHTFVSYIDDLIELPELGFFDQTIKNARVVFRSSSVSAQLRAIRSGVGLGLVHCFMAKNKPDLQMLLADQVCVERAYWLLVHEDLRQVARIDAVCRFLSDLLADHKDLMMGNT